MSSAGISSVSELDLDCADVEAFAESFRKFHTIEPAPSEIEFDIESKAGRCITVDCYRDWMKDVTCNCLKGATSNLSSLLIIHFLRHFFHRINASNSFLSCPDSE